ncbi:MAG: hypothetical protein HYY04_18995 [Chloroflexi bacterium]|nr:hypothetical protein [Chloroflexota bacterium]
MLRAHLEELFVQYLNLKALTMDAIFAQRGLCQMLVDQKRGYTLQIKGNQPNVCAAFVETFADAPQRQPDAQSVDKRDGCVQTRRLWLDQEVARSAATELGCPGAQQAGRLEKRILHLDTGVRRFGRVYYLVGVCSCLNGNLPRFPPAYHHARADRHCGEEFGTIGRSARRNGP